MQTRLIALFGALLSLLALGFAVAQIMPTDRSRLPAAQTPTATPAATPATPAPAGPAAAPPATSAAKPATSTLAPASLPAKPPQPGALRGFDNRAAKVEVLDDVSLLDPRIQTMRERLIEASRSGNIERLNIVFQMNETMPTFTRGNERDPVAFWKSVSGDGQGLEILAILRNILDQQPARINAGTAQEMIVWPYLAELPLDTLTATQQVDLYRLVTAQDVRDMKTLGKWAFWRLGIGKDGTLHYFVAGQ